MKIAKTIIAIALLLALTITALAQQNGQPTNGAPKLVIESVTHDFGDVEPGSPLSYSFKIKNEGTVDLLIQSVRPG